jgi:ribokinase
VPGVLVLGSLNVDHVVRVAALPVPGETLLSDEYSIVPGGKGRNQAAVVAALGGRAWMAGAVADDASGAWLRDDIARLGVDLSLLQTVTGVATGLAFITVDSAGENTIVVHPGANSRVVAVPAELLDRSRHPVLLCSFEVPLPAVAVTASSARSHGMTTVVNAAPMVGVGDGRLAAILEHTDILIVNRSEAAELVGRPSVGVDPVAAVAGWRRPHSPEVIVTLGAEGAVRIGDDGLSRFPAFKVEARSTVGAGDTFAGALSLAVAGGRPLDQAINAAMAAAAAFVSGDLTVQQARAILSAGA